MCQNFTGQLDGFGKLQKFEMADGNMCFGARARSCCDSGKEARECDNVLSVLSFMILFARLSPPSE